MTDLIELFKMLSDETRLRILLLLSKKALCVCEICDILNEPQPKVSRHLTKLRDMGFVKDERQGQWIFYSLNIQDELFDKIFQCISGNTNLYPVIKGDMEKLQVKMRENKMCNRTN
ncbi:ArsR/SmtB family transcription factor [Lacrimispora sp. 38-1]|uniref:ArsR/SmtB family transcription factor n=1 Tax=Lacrimispora sp. 38-1 TaxID=3125778 RepID=UPI003CED6574